MIHDLYIHHVGVLISFTSNGSNLTESALLFLIRKETLVQFIFNSIVIVIAKKLRKSYF